jgi:hypothetical protein
VRAVVRNALRVNQIRAGRIHIFLISLRLVS